MKTVEPDVRLIAWTHFQPPDNVPWNTDAHGGQALAEFAGRACYQSWDKPNPGTSTNAGYLKHILEVGHLSVIEHGTATFYFTGVSRSLTHELIRHRHFSYSQLSQRYVTVDAAGGEAVVPDVIVDDPYLAAVFTDAFEHTQQAYRELCHALERRMEQAATVCLTCRQPVKRFEDPVCWRCDTCGKNLSEHQVGVKDRTAVRKQARQAARAVLPNATETRIVVTGNYRAWRHFIAMRATEHADVEIREVAMKVLDVLKTHAPNVFGDFQISELADGTRIAGTHLRHDQG